MFLAADGVPEPIRTLVMLIISMLTLLVLVLLMPLIATMLSPSAAWLDSNNVYEFSAFYARVTLSNV